MKRSILILVLALSILFIGACDSSNCTQCGFDSYEHIVTSYTDSTGSTIYVSGYADANGCFRPDGCQ